MNLENWQKFCDKYVMSIVIIVLIVFQQRWSGYKKRWHWYCRHIKKVSLVCSLEPELFVLCWWCGDNADDDNEENEEDKNDEDGDDDDEDDEDDEDDDGDKDIARQSSEITKQATAVDATPTKQQQGYFMQPPTATAVDDDHILVKW